MRDLSPDLAAKVETFLDTMRSTPLRYDEGFPDSFAEYVFLYANYASAEILKAVLDAAAATGEHQVLYLPKEVIENEPPHDRLVGVDEISQLTEHIHWGLEFYVASPQFDWLVWAYHEPCLHIGGSKAFVSRFKEAYPRWQAEYSPWYEEGGIPVCTCGVWWHPGMGEWSEARWRCHQCSGISPTARVVNKTGWPKRPGFG